MTQQEQLQDEPVLVRGGAVQEAALIAGTTLANYGLGPFVKQGAEWLQSHFQHDPPPHIERPPGYDHDR